MSNDKKGIMKLARYIAQALRAYRHKSVGQFDQVTKTKVELTQDAADLIDTLSDELKERADRVTHSFDDQPARTAGTMQDVSWGTLKGLLDAHENSRQKVASIIVTPKGLSVCWEFTTEVTS